MGSLWSGSYTKSLRTPKTRRGRTGRLVLLDVCMCPCVPRICIHLCMQLCLRVYPCPYPRLYLCTCACLCTCCTNMYLCVPMGRRTVCICVWHLSVCLFVCLRVCAECPSAHAACPRREAAHRAWQVTLRRVKGRSKTRKKNLLVQPLA